MEFLDEKSKTACNPCQGSDGGSIPLARSKFQDLNESFLVENQRNKPAGFFIG
jgi:hypothetical protein